MSELMIMGEIKNIKHFLTETGQENFQKSIDFSPLELNELKKVTEFFRYISKEMQLNYLTHLTLEHVLNELNQNNINAVYTLEEIIAYFNLVGYTVSSEDLSTTIPIMELENYII